MSTLSCIYIRTLKYFRVSLKLNFRYKINKKTLDEGLYLSVAKVTKRENPDKSYIAKIITKKYIEEDRLAKMGQEIETLCNLDHPNIPKYHKIIEGRRKIYLITDTIKGLPIKTEIVENLRVFTGKHLCFRISIIKS